LKFCYNEKNMKKNPNLPPTSIALVVFLGIVITFISYKTFTPLEQFFLTGPNEIVAGVSKWKSRVVTPQGLRLAPAAEATTTAHVVVKKSTPVVKAKPTTNSTTAATTTNAGTPAVTSPTTIPPATTPAQQTAPVTQPPAPAPTPVPAPAPGESRFTVYITAYTYWDNTPPGSSDISNPIIHTKAGGTGTFGDPITLAVGHSYATGSDVLDYPAGTKFYLPNLRKYFIVEDTCGDGSHPENGPCHTGYQGHPWFDLWIEGANGTSKSTTSCAEDITELHLVIENPAANYAVVPGAVFSNACATQFGDTVTSS
jgi:hypothetical protein